MPPLHPGGKYFFDPALDPVWAACVDVGFALSQHGGTGAPDYQPASFASFMVLATEHSFYSGRSLWQLILGGVFDRFPTLKIITHHCGGMVPFFAGRVSGAGQANLDAAGGVKVKVSRPTMDYFKMFYGDTALSGYTPGLMLGYNFFGADHVLFGTDAPFGEVKDKIASVANMAIPESDKAKIFSGNARRLLGI